MRNAEPGEHMLQEDAEDAYYSIQMNDEDINSPRMEKALKSVQKFIHENIGMEQFTAMLADMEGFMDEQAVKEEGEKDEKRTQELEQCGQSF